MARTLEKPYGAVLARVMQAYGVSTLGELARRYQIPENTVRNWHKRDNVPLNRIEEAAAASGKPFEWFTKGGSTRFFLPSKANELAKSATADALLANKSAYGAATDAFGQGSEVTKKDNLFAKSASADAYGVYPPRENLQHGVAAMESRPAYGPRAWDAELMRTVLRVVTEQLRSKGLELPADKLAELVVLIYEHVADEAVPIDQVEGTTQRYLRLVA